MLEVCVDSVESALNAEAGGADRVELCGNLPEGGTTPSAGLTASCCERLRIPVHVLIRPRGGDFVYSDIELDVMRRDIAVAHQHGAAGVVIGVLDAAGAIDIPRIRSLVAAARPLAVTFHRAFDFTADRDQALDDLIALGVDRLLTSGQAQRALEGTAVLARLGRRAAGRIAIAAGGGLSEENILAVIERTGVTHVHVSAAALLESTVTYRPTHLTLRKPPLPNEYDRAVTDPGRIRRIAELLRQRALPERPC